MTLPKATMLEDRYRIETMLSQGGMGAVYKAFDTNLKTPVAIKENFFQTPESIHQFEQEALILARLRHRNLPRVIHHFSTDEKVQYLVMDFIEGEDLWEIVKASEHPLEEKQALKYIINICDAVSYLHRQTPPIIHRDIKPQNIKITPAGQAILVDFGIAKIADDLDSRTRTGAQALTPGFSPPEQYGGGTTRVSDVYALGATLYALLTGQKPPDSVSLMVGGGNFKPPHVINPKLSRQVSHTIVHAMQLKKEDRPQSMAEWKKELQDILDGTAPRPDEPDMTMLSAAKRPAAAIDATLPSSRPKTKTQPTKSGPPWALIGGAVLILAVIGAIAFFVFGGSAADQVETPGVAVIPSPTASATPTSPPESTPDPGTDTDAIAAVVATELAKSGGSNEEVDTEATIAAAVAATTTGQAQAGSQATLESLAATATFEAIPSDTPSPTSTGTPTPIPTETSTSEPVTDTPTPPPTLPVAPALGDQRIIFESNRDGPKNLYALSLDVNRTVSNVTSDPANDEYPALSANRTQVAFQSNREGGLGVYVMGADGSNARRIANSGDSRPAWSPDGSRVATKSAESGELGYLNASGGGFVSVTAGGQDPSWSPDGGWLVFTGSGNSIQIINIDGTGQGELSLGQHPVWSPNGQRIAFTSAAAGGGDTEICTMNADGSNVGCLVDGEAPTWSPDGSQLAYSSRRTGNWEIWIMNADGSNNFNMTNHPADDKFPAWSR